MRFLIFLAILPSALLARAVYNYDRIEKEPIGLLVKIFVFGMISCIPAAIIESFGAGLASRIAPNAWFLSALTYLVIVPGAEEFVKYRAMRVTWKDPAFNYTFDGIVYGVMAALGFATLENILYVIEFGELMTAVMRGIFSVPLHCTCGAIMGYFYGVARGQDARGNDEESRKALRLAIAIPWIIHGFYDFSLDTGSVLMLVLGLIATLAVFLVASRQVRFASANDQPIDAGFQSFMAAPPATRSPEGTWANKGTPPPPFNR